MNEKKAKIVSHETQSVWEKKLILRQEKKER